MKTGGSATRQPHSTLIHTRVEVASGVALHVCVSTVPGSETRPVLIFCHGFGTTGIENQGIFIRASREAARRGYATVLVDQRGCGYSDGCYEDYRISTASRDLATIVRWAQRSVQCDGGAVVWAQSLGTAVAALACAHPPLQELRSLILWNLSAEVGRRYPAIFPNASRSGAWFVEHKGILVGAGFLDDAASCDVMGALDHIACPLLLLNCGADAVGDASFAQRAAAQDPSKRDQVVIQGATHSFLCQPEQEQEAITVSLDWLDLCLGKGTAMRS
jgi:pimeloyl-ACP methyl ester carboxylesterase